MTVASDPSVAVLPGAAGQQGIAHGLERRPVALRETNSHRVGAIVAHHWRRRRFAFQNRRGVGRDLLRREAGARRHAGIDLKRNGRSADGIFDSVQNIDHAVNFADRLRHFRRPCLQQCRVLRKQFDLHRLRLAGQVADHVLQHLYELDSHRRLLGGYFCAHIFDDVVDAAAAIFLQLDQDVAAVRFGHRRQSQFQAGAPRCTLDFRNGIQNLLHGSSPCDWSPQEMSRRASSNPG